MIFLILPKTQEFIVQSHSRQK
eukprot:COSAG02_NODE_49219_length_328_cov_0.746725_1_plen_21_part_10